MPGQPERKNNLAERLFYIFLLGLISYGWWKASVWVKRKIDELDSGTSS